MKRETQIAKTVEAVANSNLIRGVTIPIGNHQTCQTCHEAKPDAKERIDNGLKAGVHCNKCWNDMISECRSRSW